MKNHETIDDFSQTNGTNLKRKWYYGDENALNSTQMAKTIRKSVTMCYDYENYNPNHQVASPSMPAISQIPSSSASIEMTATNTNTISYHDMNISPKIIDQSTNDIDLNDGVEYVNILYENSLLSTVDNPIMTEPNYINFDTNWSNADILDLDQRDFYYETTTIADDDHQKRQNDHSHNIHTDHTHHSNHHHQHHHNHNNHHHRHEHQQQQTHPQHQNHHDLQHPAHSVQQPTQHHDSIYHQTHEQITNGVMNGDGDIQHLDVVDQTAISVIDASPKANESSRKYSVYSM